MDSEEEINVKIQIIVIIRSVFNTLNNNTNILNQYYNIQLSKQNMKLEMSSF